VRSLVDRFGTLTTKTSNPVAETKTWNLRSRFKNMANKENVNSTPKSKDTKANMLISSNVKNNLVIV
jgi:hypothetical protein